MQRGDNLQISVELMNAADKTEMWGEQYNRRAADLQLVQAEIARTISEKLRLRLTGAQEQQLTKRATENPQAYQLYLTGRFYWNKRTPRDLEKAIENFQQAISLDPKYGLAYSGLADCYNVIQYYGDFSPGDVLGKAKAAATKALEIDDTLAEAHPSLGK